MEKEMDFFIYLIENYANYKNTTAQEVIKKLEEYGLTKYVFDMYEMYHIESIENAYNDIDKLIAEKERK